MAETESEFQGIPERLAAPLPIEFYHTTEQKRLFGSFNPGRTGLTGLTRPKRPTQATKC